MTLKNASAVLAAPSAIKEYLTPEITQATGFTKPVAWVRFRSDGGYDGPIMDDSRDMDDIRRRSGAWTALVSAQSVEKKLSSMTRMFNAACADLGLISEALGLDPDDGGAEPIISAIEELKNATPSTPAVTLSSEPVAVIGDVFGLYWCGTGPIAPIIARHNLKVGDYLYAAAQPSEEAEFEVWQEDKLVAATTGPRKTALAEAMRYAAQYIEDGPTSIIEVIRKEVKFDNAMEDKK